MKKRFFQFLSLLCLLSLTCATAWAAETEEPTNGFRNLAVESAYQQDVELTPLTEKDATVAVKDGTYPGAVKMDVVYKTPQENSEYVLFVLTDDNAPSVDNIAYIDQQTGKSGTPITFTVYPKKLPATTASMNYSLYLSSNTDASTGTGITSYTKIASFSYYAAATVKLGDVDEDTDVTAIDARIALQMSSGVIAEKDQTDKQKAAADVDKDGDVTAIDARMILQFASGILTTF